MSFEYDYNLLVRLRLLGLHDDSSSAVLVLEVDAFEVANHGRCNVVVDSELDLWGSNSGSVQAIVCCWNGVSRVI